MEVEQTQCYASAVNNCKNRTDTGLHELLRSIRLSCQLMTRLEMMHILQAQVCGLDMAQSKIFLARTAHSPQNPAQ